MSEKFIIVKGAREHNLKNIDVKIPRNKFIVFTGLSGSGKSTLAFDTIFAEGQRKYLESLSSYARQFLGQMDKPDVDYIHGLSPAISIDQKSAGHNPRSTVGTVTEIHDYLRLLYAKIGKPHCPKCGREITSLSVEEIVEKIMEFPENEKVEILSPIIRQRKGEYTSLLKDIFRKGFSNAYVNKKKIALSNWKKVSLARYKKHDIDVIIDQVDLKAENISRIFEDVENALKLAEGLVKIRTKRKEIVFNRRLSCPFHDVGFPEMEPRLFSFNAPQGACPQCEGLGEKKEIDLSLLLPDKNKTIEEGAFLPWNYKRNNFYGQLLKAVAQKFNIPLNTRVKDLPKNSLDSILYGPDSEEYDDQVTIRYHFKSGSGYYNIKWKGLTNFLLKKYQETESDSMRREIEKYMSNHPCSLCRGTRYRKETLLVTVGGKNIAEFSNLPIREALVFINRLKLRPKEKLIAERIIKEISNRLSFLVNVGLDYLTLSRTATTLSGGEAQRIRLASQIGSGLVGVLYILDEPSIGLHAKDNEKLLKMLLRLKELGNTVIVIEHDEETIRAGEFIVDIGPYAGKRGGQIVHAGTWEELIKNKRSVTAQYLRKEKIISLPIQRRISGNRKFITIRGASHHNLKNISVEIPTKVFVCITGVSGSGKSTLVEDILYKNLSNKINRSLFVPGKIQEITGFQDIRKVIMIDQSPIGRTPRSNPATYTGAFTPIRKLFAQTQDAKIRGYQMGRFSFNIPGGRCENCKGDGHLKVEMQFMPDVYLPCEICKAKRYNSETLKVKYKGKNIADILDMTINEAEDFFKNFTEIHSKLKTLKEVGLGYIQLGQSATTLSGGEAQRIKLASELSRRNQGETLYILDEPTTGLHFDDVKKLLSVLNKLVEAGNSVVVIEHNLDVIKTADWIIDLGPEGGDRGGRIVVSGPPEEVIKYHQESHTARYLREYLKK
jgi:excinuclease ABC subunit A